MALAAAWFETGEDPDEGEALRWLERLGEPCLVLPPRSNVSPREIVTVFVPVNDAAGPSSAILQSAPVTRSKQPRTFPTVWVGDAKHYLYWPQIASDQVVVHWPALERLCGKITRIGHSSSLVRMWLGEGPVVCSELETWLPDDNMPELQVRRVGEGTLDLLDRQFNRRGREQHERLSNDIELLKAEKKGIRGKGAADEKEAIDQRITKFQSELELCDPRPPIRPKLGLWTGYRKEQPPASNSRSTDFDSDLLVLCQTEGPRLPSVSSLAVTQALRGAILSHCSDQPPPSWISGHSADGQPLRDGQLHIACVALPFVGSPHADGHLLGAAVAFPRSVSRPDRGRALGKLLLDSSGEPKPMQLMLGSLGVWTLQMRDWSESRQTLKPETWTATPNGATAWASVTPVVLDQFPKCDATKDRHGWNLEVAEILINSCRRVGLPDPEEIDFGTTSRHLGGPRATPKHRPLRGQVMAEHHFASLGDGFPSYPPKGANAPRPQLHVYLRFSEQVVGPVLLGAGRFQGYGLCKPLWGGNGR